MCIKSELKEICLNLATNGQSDKVFLLTSKICPQGLSVPALGLYTGHSCYVDFAYLDTTTYVEVIFQSNIFSLYFFAFRLRLCRKRLTRSNGYPEVIFHALDVFSVIFASVYVEVLNRRSHGRHIVCFGYVHV